MIITAQQRPDVAGSSSARQAPRYLYVIPLVLILIAQAILSSRILLHGTVASPDEARYITAGHHLIYELWHGGGSPYYETYFSGAPDLYSPLAAMADAIGGLTAVRLMSLVFMLLATVMLYATAKQLFTPGSGIAAAGLFAGIGLTQDLGVYANYDALALLFMSCAAYCAARSKETRWLLLVPVALLASNIAKYMTIIFDPIVIGIAALQVEELGWKRVSRRALSLGISLVSVLTLCVYIAGSAYIAGIMFTTLARPSGSNAVLSAYYEPTHAIVGESISWIGGILVLGIASLPLAGRSRVRLLLLLILVIAGFLVTVEALRLHSDESMRQHDDFGAWFTCVSAGYALSVISEKMRWLQLKIVAVVGSSILVIVLGAHYSALASTTYEGKVATQVRTVMKFASVARPYLSLPDARYLMGGILDYQIVYMDHINIQWFSFSDDIYLKYPIPGRGGDSHGEALGRACLKIKPGCMYLEGPAAYRAAIRAHYFAFVSMMGGHHKSKQDRAIEQAVQNTVGYVLLTHAGGAPTWIYAPAYQHWKLRPA